MPATPPRPRTVNAAFWCWVLATMMLILFGLLLALSQSHLPIFFRGAGVLFVLAGIALGYLAGRTRQGDRRFRRAAVAFALVLVVLLALFSVLSTGLIWLLIMIL